MSSERQDPRGFHPPTTTTTTTDHLTGNNPSGFTTLRLPHSPSPVSPAVKTTTPESRLADALGHALFTIPSTSFQDAAAATTVTVDNHNPLRRTLSDTSSSFTQDISAIITTPPKAPESARRNSPLRRTTSDTTSSFNQDLPTITTTAPEPARRTNPLRRALSDPFSDYQPPQKTRKTPPPKISPSPNPRTTPPESSTRKQTPSSERLRKMEDMFREIVGKCWDVIGDSQENLEDDSPPNEETIERDECIGVERLNDGGLRIRLDCSCGKGFELLLKDNDYCFYRLT